MSSPRYVLGVDGGTGGIRAGLFEIATGAPVGFADTPYETRYPHPGWAEQDPRAWWAGMASSVRRVLAEARVAPADGRSAPSDSGSEPSDGRGHAAHKNVIV